jgi:hypothetical protein
MMVTVAHRISSKPWYANARNSSADEKPPTTPNTSSTSTKRYARPRETYRDSALPMPMANR